MTNLVPNVGVDLESLLIHGDLSKLTAAQRISYYKMRCDEHGLSVASRPFDYIKLNGKEVLYANKGCAEQLRSVHKISIKITKAEKVDDIFVVIAEAVNGKGRGDSATGAVSISGLKGEPLANAMMKAETKAKRRVTLSICGLNMLDETEVETLQKPNIGHGMDQQAESDGLKALDDGKWRFTFGQWRGRTVEEVCKLDNVGPQGLAGYIDYLEKSAANKNEPLSARAMECISHIEDFLGSLETQPQD